MQPATPQPFSPPVEAASVWAIPREGFPELAASLYAQVTWGREPHPAQVTQAEQDYWEAVRPAWERATEMLFEQLAESGHVAIAERVGSSIETDADKTGAQGGTAP